MCESKKRSEYDSKTVVCAEYGVWVGLGGRGRCSGRRIKKRLRYSERKMMLKRKTKRKR